MKNSPHYAGPTFHASPAPSALPIPSLFSKSVPDSRSAPVLEMDSDTLETETEMDSTPSKPKSYTSYKIDQKPTPVDFLFKAALEARNPKGPDVKAGGDQSPTRQTRDSTSPSQRKTENSTTGGIFELDMENGDMASRISRDGASIAASYNDRMNSVRSPVNATTRPVENMGEDERRAKSEALKNLILNPRPQKPPASASPLAARDKLPSVNGNGHSVTNSTPSAVAKHSRITPGPLASDTNANAFRQNKFVTRSNPSSPFFPTQSGQQYNSPSKTNGSTVQQTCASNKALETRQMEDDLRRILKIGTAAPVMQSSGVESSYA